MIYFDNLTKMDFFSEFIFAIDFSQKKIEESIFAIGSY